jgi:hypothetical protein
VAKITRKKLSRGTKLMPEHVYPPLADAAAQLQGVAIEKEQMKAPMAPFRVNLTLPYLTSDSLPAGTMTIPIALPPVQDEWRTITNAAGGKTPVYAESVPQMKLKSVSFSFDQRAEPAAIASQFWTFTGATAGTGDYAYSSEQGKLSFEDVTKLDIGLSLHEKTQMYFGDSYPYRVEGELWSTVIPASPGLSGRAFRANPFIQTDIDVAIDPFKTLVLSIDCPGLADASGRNLCLPSIEVSLRFVCELMPRDSGSTSVQNIPDDGGSGTGKYGAKTGPTVSITTPAAGTAVESDSSDGVNYNISTIDEQFQDKLEGGYNKFGDVPPTEVITDDAAYEVIAVPLYQNMAHGGLSAAPAFYATYPYLATISGVTVTSAANIGAFDRRVIPIHHSYSVHHAILAWNWAPWNVLNWDGSGAKPIASGGSSGVDQQKANLVCPTQDVGLQVGVGIGTGLGADGFEYEQLASLTITNPNNYSLSGKTPKLADGPATTGSWDASIIDRITSTLDPPRVMLWNSGGTAGVSLPKWNWELHSIPLVGAGSFAGGAGYYTQGKEIFVGPGWTKTSARTNIGASGVPDTGGAEQWLEVRASLFPNASGALNNMDYQFDSGATPISDHSSILVGYGGCYVYLICKKHLTK